MAKKGKELRGGSRKLSDPLGGGGRVNVMESGLTHCADSLAGGRHGTYIQYFGSPGEPTHKSPGVKSGGGKESLYPNTPNLLRKFQKDGNR